MWTVVLRAGVNPEDYWKVRKELEKGMNGKKIAHLFVKDGLQFFVNCSLVTERVTAKSSADGKSKNKKLKSRSKIKTQ